MTELDTGTAIGDLRRIAGIMADRVDDDNAQGDAADLFAVADWLAAPYRLFVNDSRTSMVHVWPDGSVDVAARDHPSHTWGPPVTLAEEPLR